MDSGEARCDPSPVEREAVVCVRLHQITQKHQPRWQTIVVNRRGELGSGVARVQFAARYERGGSASREASLGWE